MMNSLNNSIIENSFFNLYEYVKKDNYEGFDLFDGLKSKLFRNSIFYKNRFARLGLIQFCKKSPINLRKILMVPKGFNSKAGALFLMGNLNIYKTKKDEKYKKEAEKLYKKLKQTLIKREKGIGWGYNFDWQARAFFVPENTPNIVTSVFVGKSLLEYYEEFKNEEALNLAIRISDFILNEMVMFEDENNLCFSYIPKKNTAVHNANLLAASFLSSLLKYTQNKDTKTKIIKAINFSTKDINKNGSWPYGTKPFHRWVDNFHTAFNIESLLNIQENTDIELKDIIQKISSYYLEELFTKEGQPKYYNKNLYPIDIHVIAEVLVVLNKIKSSNINYDQSKFKRIEQKLMKQIKLFQDPKGYFYYQKTKYFWNKVPYIRWAQAWMFYGLSYSILKNQMN